MTLKKSFILSLIPTGIILCLLAGLIGVAEAAGGATLPMAPGAFLLMVTAFSIVGWMGVLQIFGWIFRKR